MEHFSNGDFYSVQIPLIQPELYIPNFMKSAQCSLQLQGQVTSNIYTRPRSFQLTQTSFHPLPSNLSRVGDFKILESLGKGNFAEVKLAEHVITGDKVAIKIIQKNPKSLDKDSEILKNVYREVQILKMLQHPNITELYQVINTDSNIFLIMEYASGGDTFEKISRLPNKRFNEEDSKRIIFQTTLALEFCHRNNIVHRDLKAENLLLDLEGNVKLADFGFASFFRSNQSLHTFCGSPPYAAPEVFGGKPYDGTQTDVWSLGVLLFVLITGYFPFQATSVPAMRDLVTAAHFQLPTWVSAECEALIRKMIVVNPQKRISIRGIKKDPWLQSVAKQQVEVIRAGRSSTPQPNDINEQVLKLMQAHNFDRQRVLESVHMKKYDSNYATYTLMVKKLKSLSMKGKSSCYYSHESIKRRPSNIAEKALFKINGSCHPHHIPPVNHESHDVNRHVFPSPYFIISKNDPSIYQQQTYESSNADDEGLGLSSNDLLTNWHQNLNFLKKRIHRRHSVAPDITSYVFPTTIVQDKHPLSLVSSSNEQVISQLIRRSSGFCEETFSLAAKQNDEYSNEVTSTRSSPVEHQIYSPYKDCSCGHSGRRRASDGLLRCHDDDNKLSEQLRRLRQINGFLAITQEEDVMTSSPPQKYSTFNPSFARQPIMMTLPSQSFDHMTSQNKANRAYLASPRRRSIHSAPYYVPRSRCTSPHDRDSPMNDVTTRQTRDQLKFLEHQAAQIVEQSSNDFITTETSREVMTSLPLEDHSKYHQNLMHQRLLWNYQLEAHHMPEILKKLQINSESRVIDNATIAQWMTQSK